MRYFKDCTTIQEVKSTYRTLALKNHPDRGGNVEVMAEINRQYKEALEWVARHQATASSSSSTAGQDGKRTADDLDGGYMAVINALIGIKGIEIELCGTWLWISGETKKNRLAIKNAGCHWAKKKLMWYWRPEEYRCRSRKSCSMDYIREKYGSEKIVSAPKMAQVTA